MNRITRRSDDMRIIKGINIYPSQIEQALLRVEGKTPRYLIEVDQSDRKDISIAKVEMTEKPFSSTMKKMHELKHKINRPVQSITGLHMNIELVSPNALEGFTGKAKRSIDRRKNANFFSHFLEIFQEIVFDSFMHRHFSSLSTFLLCFCLTLISQGASESPESLTPLPVTETIADNEVKASPQFDLKESPKDNEKIVAKQEITARWKHPAPTGKSVSAYVIPVKGVISKPTEYIIRRGIKEAIQNDIDVIVLDIDTPGGRLDVTLKIMEMLDRFEGDTLAYVNPEAISAGSYISIACDAIYYAPNGLIGAAEAITATGGDISEGANRKLKSYLTAKVRALSKDHPYKSEVQRAMMDPDFILTIDGEELKSKGELLTLTAEEAMQGYGKDSHPLLGMGIYDSVEAILRARYGESNNIQGFKITWSETLAQYLDMIKPILIGIGMLCLFIEFKTPGFGIFGILGLICMSIVFLSNFVIGLAGHEPLLFFFIGFALILLEIFLFPGLILFAFSGLILILGSLVWSLADIWPKQEGGFELNFNIFLDPIYETFWGILLGILFFVLISRYLPKTWVWDKLILNDAPPKTDPISDQPSKTAAHSKDTLIGSLGTVVLPLHPSGTIEIEGKRYEAIVSIGSIEAGRQVRVIGKRQFSLEVEPLTENDD